LIALHLLVAALAEGDLARPPALMTKVIERNVDAISAEEIMQFEIDVFAWIPQPEVPNPIASLPGGTGRWGPGACGPHFGGDNFVVPAATAAGWTGSAASTFRARQNVTFRAEPWGTLAGFRTSGVIPGTTTVLTATRAAGGRVCHSLTAKVLHSSATATFVAGSAWYEVKMRGKAQDPVPAAVGGHFAAGVGESAGSTLTPALAWDLTLRLSSGSTVGFWTEQLYKADAPISIDESASCPGVSPTLGGGTASLLHGVITVRRYPSYVVFVSLTTPAGAKSSQIVFFSNAVNRSLLEIIVPWDSQLRRVTF
jgi:hypothetical protein